MCDTMVALANSTADGKVIFAKNSDRDPNEPLLTIRVPRLKHGKGARVKCTYIEIDQAEETYEALLCRPSWIWGAEMGINEWGLAIGNEAVFTREKRGPESLIGMDFLRLALERCQNSEEALDLIVTLLEKYGQGGNCGYAKKFYYDNSFLICDPEQAWVLETAGKYWAAKKVETTWAISNRFSLTDDYDRSHPDLNRHAIEKKWAKNDKGAGFNFAASYQDPLITRFSGSLERKQSCDLRFSRAKGAVSAEEMIRILRSHEAGLEGRQFSRHSMKSVCMHGGFLVGSHTTGSLVATLDPERSTIFITGGSTPCLALFKPYWLVDGEKLSFSESEDEAALSAWQTRERLHYAVLENRLTDLEGYLARRDELERDFFTRVEALGGDLSDDRRLAELINLALEEEEKLLEEALADAEQEGKAERIKGNPYFKAYWRKMKKSVNLP